LQRKQSSRQNSFVRPRKPPRLARRYQTASSASGSQQDWNLLNQIIDDILAATGIATIFVDRQMRLLRITHLARQLTGIDEQAQGRRLSDLKIETCGCPALAEHTLRVLGTLQPYECEVNSNDGRWYSLRIRPYRNPKRIPLGAVITFTDITHAHHAQEALRENERFLRESQKVAGIASYITDLSSGDLEMLAGNARHFRHRRKLSAHAGRLGSVSAPRYQAASCMPTTSRWSAS
jgi:hypothetical protein